MRVCQRTLRNLLLWGSVVVAITCLSLIVGEFVPKQIALRAPEKFAARVAPMMLLIASVAAPLIWVLDRSGKLVLRLLGQSSAPSRRLVSRVTAKPAAVSAARYSAGVATAEIPSWEAQGSGKLTSPAPTRIR